MPAADRWIPHDLVDLARTRAVEDGDRTALLFSSDSGDQPLSYTDLDRRARSVAAALAASGTAPGERALLLYPPGLDYVIGFFGCLYAGVIAVPVYPPTSARGLDRVLGIAKDSEASAALTDTAGVDEVQSRLRSAAADDASLLSLRWLSTDALPSDTAAAWTPTPIHQAAPAFLQYTSGSTAAPKGVVVGHDNLVHNSAKIAAALDLSRHSRAVSWLPPYHDMGLIGGILQPVYSGFPGVLLSPLAFLHRPVRWLQAISRHRATISAAPDFAYAECVRRISAADRAELDLSSWEHALVGAEPVRATTLADFAARFADQGFRRSRFFPCYGLAEATLYVTGGRLPPPDPDPGEADSSRPTPVSCGPGREPDTVLVIDPDRRQRVPDSEVGELWICGPTVAGGYWQRLEDTERTFRARLADPLDPRYFLRTGDLGFQTDNGDFFITGRIKELLVVRGRNHYPQDLEHTAERAHPALQPHRGAAFSTDDGSQERVILVHEVVRGFRAEQAEEVVDAVRAAVSRGHGIDLDDIALVRLGGIPRTSSGKTQRRACRDRYLAGRLDQLTVGNPTISQESAAPRTARDPVDAAAEALGVSRPALRPDVPLVAQGLDSLRAARLRFALSTEFGIDLPLPQLLARATPTTLLSAERCTPQPDRQPAPNARPLASAGQQQLWLLDQLGAGEAYRVGAGLRLRGEVDLPLLVRCVGELIRRHDVLRTTLEQDEDGQLVRVVHPWTAPEIPVFTVPPDQVIECYWRELGAPFDLKRELPLRTAIVRWTPNELVLLFSAHHIAVDGWSMGVLARELGALYATKGQGPLPDAPQPLTAPPISDDAGLEFWRRTLAGAAALELPTDRPRPARPSFTGGQVPVELPPELVARLRSIAAEQHATVFMALVAGLAAVLSRWSGQRDVMLGSVVANRATAGSEAAVGFLARTVPLRIDTVGTPTFRALLDRARMTCLDAYAHQDAPVERVLREVLIDAGTVPIRALLNLRGQFDVDFEWPGGAATTFEVPARAPQFELSFDLTERADGAMTGWAAFSSDVYDETTVRRLATALVTLLNGAVGDPDRPVSALPVLDPAEQTQLLQDWSGARVPPPGRGCVPALFESVVDRHPAELAVVGPDERLTYAELDQRANQLAHYLRGFGISCEDLVGVHLPRSPASVVSFLAILKSGAAYLPVPTDLPALQVQYLLADAQPAIVLTETEFADVLRTAAVDPAPRVVCLDEADPHIRQQPAKRPSVPLHPDNLAYVVYTSGSTGAPKGVANTHRGMSNQLTWRAGAHPLTPHDGVLHRTALSFDVSVSEMLWPLTQGARLVVPAPDGHRDPAYLSALVRDEGVTAGYFVPSVLRMLLPELGAAGVGRLGTVHTIGEELTPALATEIHRTLPGAALHNLYGPAEAAVEVTSGEVTAPLTPGRRVGLGTPIHGARLYLLDEEYAPVPIGVTGELCLGGVCLARGYLNRPALTAHRFVPNPFATGERLYRTGDLARWHPDGTLEFLGRADHQVKIRGQRVELGGIEAVLAGHPAVRAAAVTVSADSTLVAYLVCEAEPPPGAELRAFVASRLPEYMVPQVFAALPELPFNTSGKVDRGALPDPGQYRLPSSAEYQPPDTAAERLLAGIWQDVLDVDRVGRDDDFWALGGHSLMATRIAARVRGAFGVELPVGELLSGRPTLAELAASVQRRQLAQTDEDDLRGLIERLSAMSDEEVAGALSRQQRP